MIEITMSPDLFKRHIREFFQKQTLCHRKRVSKNSYIYSSAQREAMVYFIESGMIKLVLPTPEGKECLLAIRGNGEIFGELCLSGQNKRLETAIAMDDAVVKQMPLRNFLDEFKRESLLESLVQYLAVRIGEQQEVITAMATSNSELRLARTLMYLGRSIGTPVHGGMCIKQKISHLELSEMIGTTRPRVGIFLKKFRDLGLISLTDEHYLVIDRSPIENYIMHAISTDTPLKSNHNKPPAPISETMDLSLGVGVNWLPEATFAVLGQ